MPPLCYSPGDLLRLRPRSNEFPLSRQVKRKLWFLRLLKRDATPSASLDDVQPIPVRITHRQGNRISRVSERKSNDGGRKSAYDSTRSSLLRVTAIIAPAQRKLRRKRVPISRYPSILLANCRSVTNKFDELQLRTGQVNPDVVVITESWLDDDTPDTSIAIDNYRISRKDRNRNGGGILCYVKSELNCNVITALDAPALQNCATEILPIFIDSISTLLICVYHPFFNNPTKDEDAIVTIVGLIDDFLISSSRKSEDIRIVLCGDFNDIRKQSDRLCSATRLTPCVGDPTRGSHLLDQIFVNTKQPTRAVTLPPLGRSDHCAVLWKPSPSPPVTTTKTQVRKLTKSNLASFSHAAALIDWTSMVSGSDSLDQCALQLHYSIQRLVDLYFPKRTIRLRSNEPPWMKPSLKLLISRRDRAFAQRENKWLKYLRLREEVISHEKFLKSLHLQQAAASKNNKDFWQSVNCVGRRPKKNTALQADISVDEFAAYFKSVFQLPPTDKAPLPSTEDLPRHPVVLSPYEVETQLRCIKPKSSGPDGIPFWVLRCLAHLLAPPITILFNRSLAEGRVPSSFKIAAIQPIPKVTHAKTVSQFRPISLLPLLSKTLERIVVKKWVAPYLQNIDDTQFAYLPQPGSGSTCATTVTYMSILRHLDQSSGAVRVLSIDFAKAFDKLPHNTILSTIIDLKLPFEAVSWITDFLSNRLQRVVHNNATSEWCSAPSGVPQGSVLGPYLFCAVIASLRPVCSNTRYVKYADDVTVLHFMRDAHEDNLQREFEHICQWSARAGLPLNTSKSAVMDIATRTGIRLEEIADVAGTVIPSVTSMKILGVHFAKDLRWDIHCKEIFKKASKRIFVLRNLKRAGCNAQILWRVYRQTIQSLLTYCHPCCCNMSQKGYKFLVKVERRASRIIFGTSHGPDSITTTTLARTNQRSGTRLFHSVMTTINHPLRQFFDERSPTHRNSSTLKKPRCRTVRFSDSFIKYCSTCS